MVTIEARRTIPILVWKFYDAPESLQTLSDNGGDEDWLAVVPEGYGYIGWIEGGSQFGCCGVQTVHHVTVMELPDTYSGATVYIGSHA